MNYTRRFGLEIEFNSLDGKDGPYSKNKPPGGIVYVANVVSQVVNEYVEVRLWQQTWLEKNHSIWYVKPDGTCGMEVCTPILKGNYGLRKIASVINALNQDSKIKADKRCSLHVHIDVFDFTEQQIANVLTQCVKCEYVLFNSVPSYRRNNSYCQFVGLKDWFNIKAVYLPRELIKLFSYKYLSVNTMHYCKNSRSSIEFRIGENSLCLDADSAVNWIEFLVHFVEITKDIKFIEYDKSNAFSSWLWLDVDDIWKLLCLDNMKDSVKKWFVNRFKTHVESNEIGIFSQKATNVVQQQIDKLIYNMG